MPLSSDARARLFRDHILVFTHCPKTGGTSVDRALAQAFGRRRHFRVNGALHDPRRLSAEEKAEVFVLTGHFSPGAALVAGFGRTPLYLGVVRQPVARMRSLYAYRREKAARKGEPQKVAADFEAQVRHWLTHDNAAMRDTQCRFFGGEDAPAAVRRLTGDYLLCFDTGAIDAALRWLWETFGVEAPFPADTHLNRSGSARHALDPGLEAALGARLIEDARLVDWAREGRAAAFARADGRLAALT